MQCHNAVRRLQRRWRNRYVEQLAESSIKHIYSTTTDQSESLE